MAGETLRMIGLDRLVGVISTAATRADRASRLVVTEMAAVFVTQAKINASGPARISTGERAGTREGFAPIGMGEGPGVVTGANRNSIHATLPHRDGFGWMVEAGPSMIYSRRLELGFVGADSLGRVYNQPPYPFVRPALDFVRLVAPAIARRAWSNAI